VDRKGAWKGKWLDVWESDPGGIEREREERRGGRSGEEGRFSRLLAS
jgi:hypothetical protein